MTEEFISRHYCEMWRSQSERSVKKFRFNNFEKDYRADNEACRKIIGKLDGISCLAHDDE